MVRTQIYLPKQQLQFAKNEALKRNITMAQFIRDILEEIQTKTAPPKQGKNIGNVFQELAKMAKENNFKGPADLATNPDKYLYG